MMALEPCSFRPLHEPWTCAVHGGYRYRLDQPDCTVALGENSIRAMERVARDYGDTRARQARFRALEEVLTALGDLPRQTQHADPFFSETYDYETVAIDLALATVIKLRDRDREGTA